MIWAFACVLLTGCGRIAFDTRGDGGLAQPGDSEDAGDGGDGSDGSRPSGDGAITGTDVCGTTTLLADDFEDGSPASTWTVLNGTNLTTSETGGELQITFGSNVPSGQEAGYQQTTSMDYAGTCTIAELLAIPNPSANGRLEVRLTMPANAYIFFEVLAGTLHALWNDGFMQIHPGMQTWNATDHRFLRIRNSTSAWFWETSPDGITYTELARTSQTIAGAATLELHVTTSAGVGNGGQVRFGSVRVLGP